MNYPAQPFLSLSSSVYTLQCEGMGLYLSNTHQPPLPLNITDRPHKCNASGEPFQPLLTFLSLFLSILPLSPRNRHHGSRTLSAGHPAHHTGERAAVSLCVCMRQPHSPQLLPHSLLSPLPPQVAASLGPGSFGAYVISQATCASDVLAVMLLQVMKIRPCLTAPTA